MPVAAQMNVIENQMTLFEIIPIIRLLPAFDKLKLIRILAEELENAKDIFPFEIGKSYYMPTPYNMFGVAEILAKTVYQNERE